MIGVAISTTGQEHRMGFLETCVAAWRTVLPLGSVIVVTVDGSEAEAQRALEVVDNAGPKGHVGGTVWQVGQRGDGERVGVAANKNTGLELLLDHGADDLFLCDDDTWPLTPTALDWHLNMGVGHSMVCWGGSRLDKTNRMFATWSWPRGVLLYVTREVVEEVGGMAEAFGKGGHEHAEWSTRIHNHGLTPTPFVTPPVYAEQRAMGARRFWHAEDMRRPSETGQEWARRKSVNTTITRTSADWERIGSVMERQEESTAFVPFSAHENGRGSATLCRDLMGQGAGGEA